MDYITELPDCLLIEIFEYCNKRLLNLLLVCKKFNYLISTSSLMMNKLKLSIESGNIKKISETQRNHQHIFIKYDYQIGQQHFRVISEHFSALTSLEFVRCIIEADTFLNLLQNLPQLSSLYIYSTFLRSKEYIVNGGVLLNPPRLENLKSLSMRNSDFNFLRFLANSNGIEFLHLSLQSSLDMQFLVKLLGAQKKLKKLDRLNIPLINDEFLSLIVHKLKIKSLNLDSDKIDESAVLRLENKKNCTLKSVNLYGSSSCILEILKLLDTLCDLEIEENELLTNSDISQIISYQPRIQKLSIVQCPNITSFAGMKINPLEKFYFKNTKMNLNLVEWANFGKDCPNINTLILLSEIGIEFNTFKNVCNSFPKLQRIEFTYFQSDSLIIDFVYRDNFPKNIKFIEISKKFEGILQNKVLNLKEHHLRYIKNHGNINLCLKIKE